MKTLTPTNLIAVELPKDATEVNIWNHGIGFKTKLINRNPDDINGFYHLETGLFRWKGFEILGEVTDNEISFDVEPYIEIDGMILKYNLDFYGYVKKEFRSLLRSNELYFENPIDKLDMSDFDNGIGIEYDNFYENVKKWQSYESKLIKGKLIILKQN